MYNQDIDYFDSSRQMIIPIFNKSDTNTKYK